MNSWISRILMGLLTPLAETMGKGWKTATGIGLWLLVVVVRQLIEGRGFETSTLDSIETVLTYAEYAAGTLFGIGVYHKATLATPPKAPPKPPAKK